jgi:hypothetical protein
VRVNDKMVVLDGSMAVVAASIEAAGLRATGCRKRVGHQEERFRYQESSGSRQAGDFHGQEGDPRYQERGGDYWGRPPPWWPKQVRREEETREWELQQAGSAARGQGDRSSFAGQGDRAGGLQKQQSAVRAKGKRGDDSGARVELTTTKGKNKASSTKSRAPTGGNVSSTVGKATSNLNAASSRCA